MMMHTPVQTGLHTYVGRLGDTPSITLLDIRPTVVVQQYRARAVSVERSSASTFFDVSINGSEMGDRITRLPPSDSLYCCIHEICTATKEHYLSQWNIP